MRKGAAGYGLCILSSAIRVTSTFADVAYFKRCRLQPMAFLCYVVKTEYHKVIHKTSQFFKYYIHLISFCNFQIEEESSRNDYSPYFLL